MKKSVRVWAPTALGATKSSFTLALRCKQGMQVGAGRWGLAVQPGQQASRAGVHSAHRLVAAPAHQKAPAAHTPAA